MAKRRKAGKTVSLPMQILRGGMCGLFLFMIIIAIFSYLIYETKIAFPESSTQLLLLGICAFFSSFMGFHGANEKRLLLVYGSGLCLLLLLAIISALFFGIEAAQIPIQLLIVFIGCSVYFLLGLVPSRKRYHR